MGKIPVRKYLNMSASVQVSNKGRQLKKMKNFAISKRTIRYSMEDD